MEFGLSNAFAGTLEGVSTQFSGVCLISLGSNSGTPFLPGLPKGVNTIFVFVLEDRWRWAPERSGDQVKFYGHL